MATETTIDISQWLAVNEETLFLHDGLLRVTDLIELPKNVICTSERELEQEVISFDTTSPTELTQRILALCGSQSNTYSRLVEYRLNAVLGLWKAHHALAVEQNGRISSMNNEETITLLKQQGLLQQAGENESFSSRVSLLLIYPLLQSQSRLDPSLCGHTTVLLLNCLQECPPLSLSKEPVDCLNGLESLLCTWLGETRLKDANETIDVDVTGAQIQDSKERENAASALVALACARGSMKTFIHTIYLLQKLPELSGLAVSNILNKLLALQGGFGYPSALLGSKHILCWSFEDLLNSDSDVVTDMIVSDRDFDCGRSITCDDKFIYTTNSCGNGLSKIGNGLNGSLRGFVYCKNAHVGPGWVAMVDGRLLFRHYFYDDHLSNMADFINTSTLQVEERLHRPDDKVNDDVEKGKVTTIQFCSDGKYLYWIWCLPVNDKTLKSSCPVYVNIYQLKDGANELIIIRSKILLQKKDESTSKSVNESLMAKLRPFRSSAAAQHASTSASSVGSSSASSNQEASSLSSCGIPLKSLLRVPIYTCGSSVVIVTTVIGCGSASRALFGTSSTVSGHRALATNLTFSLNDGQFVARNDLTDAPTSALARGAPLHSLGICYDHQNNMIWTCSSDYIDQYLNPGHQALHHVHKKMQIDTPLTITDERLSPAEVIRALLQHVGTMCCHHLSCDFLQTPLGTLLLQQQQPLDLSHFTRVLDILELATRASDHKITCCALIIIQVIFKTFVFGKNSQEQLQLMNRLSAMVWVLLGPNAYKFEANPPNSNFYYGVQAEACQAIASGMDVLYPSSQDKCNLLSSLISKSGDDIQPHKYLRELILCDLAEALQNSQNADEQLNMLSHYAMDLELIKLLLSLSVNEWSQTLNTLRFTNNQSEFDLIVLNLPQCSPCLRYLSAYQNYLLKKVVLHSKSIKQSNEWNGGVLQNVIEGYAQLVFYTSFEILESLKKAFGDILSSAAGEISAKCRLLGINRAVKSSAIGYLLPLLVTCLTHDNIRSLKFAESLLLPKLVKLVVSSCQVLFLLRSSNLFDDPSLLLRKDDDLTQSSDLLSGLKIPVPWATGRIIESTHPVRDNYRFKETVQIPGARCLYLRFDPRCSTQYDYDKLMIYAGPNANNRKVAEFGGNTIGYGSRSVLGSGWPKDLLKVDGDTVTFSFEMRSGREHNTPDKALWGFLITVRAQENTQDISVGIPFIPDLILMLSSVTCDMLKLLFEGCSLTDNEEMCKHLLLCNLLQRSPWKSCDDDQVIPADAYLQFVSSGKSPIENEIIAKDADVINVSTNDITKHFVLSLDVLKKLRALSSQVAPQFRPSIRNVIKPDLIESRIVSAIVKHMGLHETINNLFKSSHDLTKHQHLKSIMTEVYKKTDALVRRLQILSELENKWYMELEDIRKGLMPAYMSFFTMHHLLESQAKELALLCCLKDVPFNPLNLESVINALREKMETEARADDAEETDTESMPKTRKIVDTMLERAELLLYLSVCPNEKLSTANDSSGTVDSSRNAYCRSLSAPSQLWEFPTDFGAAVKIYPDKRMSLSLKDSDSLIDDFLHSEGQSQDNIHLLEEIFLFIGKLPKKVVSCETYLSAVRTRNKRAKTRCQALVLMKELLTSASQVKCAAHLVMAITSLLHKGPKVEELTCSGLVKEVNEGFADTMSSVVQVAALNPFACYDGIGLLCTIPFTRSEERCLVNSGLVHLLDRLCSLSNSRDSIRPSGNADKQSIQQKVSALAWAGFQVLSNRCVMWEDCPAADLDSYPKDAVEHSGLASQVATLLTNHLARATECSSNEAAGNEALQEVLSLLNNLSRSRLGRAILSQSSCVSKLLSLLVDHRPSPKLILVILQLCRFALPLMTAENCDKVILPEWNSRTVATPESPMETSSKIVRLLISKLGDFLIPGLQTSLSRRPSISKKAPKRSDSEVSLDYLEELMLEDEPNQNIEESAVDCSQERQLSIFLHKREDQSAHEVIQLLLSGTDSHLFRLNGQTNLERIVFIDKELSKNGKAEISTDPARSALRKCAKWASLGLVLSTSFSIDGGMSVDDVGSDKKKTGFEAFCKEKNFELARTDPVRPFISGNVANSMASEVITLLHSLLSPSVPHVQLKSSKFWTSAIMNVLNTALSEIPNLVKLTDGSNMSQSNLLSVMMKAKQILASLCILGGFKETVKPGSEVEITGPGIVNSHGEVVSISEADGLAMVKILLPSDGRPYPRASNVVEVSLSRLSPPRTKVLCIEKTAICRPLVIALHTLLSSEGAQTLFNNLSSFEGSTLGMTIARVLAEIQTRASMVLEHYLHFDYFVHAYIKDSGSAVRMLKTLAKECVSGDRKSRVLSNCQRLRMLYRDCAKPPPPPCKSARKTSEITWNISKLFPPVRSCLFTNGDCAITFLGDTSASSGLPRGTIVYASKPVPSLAPSFYWEIQICSFGDSQEDNGPVVSFGFAPVAEKREGAWTNPVGTVLFHNNGRAVHYNGSSLLQWKSVRLNISLGLGDIVGCGWEKSSNGHSGNPNDIKGFTFFTFNGMRLPAILEDVSGGMWPIVHIQKKNTRIKANFGCHPFKYSKGHEYRYSMPTADDCLMDEASAFDMLPFHDILEMDSDAAVRVKAGSSSPEPNEKSDILPCIIPSNPKPKKEYNVEHCLLYKQRLSLNRLLTIGPDHHFAKNKEEDRSDGDDEAQQEDYHSMLVKAWESKVFPIIRRRFRNEAERKDGLEQIRGALQLGMTDIARQTVEFLYEENGGMPRDLYLPTIEDMQEEAAKFSINQISKGTVVMIRDQTSSHGTSTSASGSTLLPKFAVHSMLKTFGLIGVVLDMDVPRELIQVETYLQSEGVLVRYWYPIEAVERTPHGARKPAIIGSQTIDTRNVLIHKEMLRNDQALARICCRSALLQLISFFNRTEITDGFDDLVAVAQESAIAASCAASLQELDVENLQLLSDDCLVGATPNGHATETSLNTCTSPQQCLKSLSNLPSDLFYVKNNRLCSELTSAIGQAAQQGEGCLIELTNQICLCLQLAPERFLFEEITVPKDNYETDVYFPGANFVMVSCRAEGGSKSKRPQLAHKTPFARIYCYNGSKVKNDGSMCKQEVIYYPHESASSCMSTASGTMTDYFPSAILACDKVMVKCGCSSNAATVVCLHSVPPQLPLALAYIEQLLLFKHHELTKETSKCPDDELPVSAITTAVLLNIVELLGGYILHTDIPVMLKEKVFHLLAEVLRTLHVTAAYTHKYCKVLQDEQQVFFPPSMPIGGQIGSTMSLLLQLQMELKQLFREETLLWSPGPGNLLENGIFSSYFQALLEVCLAISEVTTPSSFAPLPTLSSLGSSSSTDIGNTFSLGSLMSSLVGDYAQAASNGILSVTLNAPPSPALSKRKKLKAKREADKSAPKSQSGSCSPRSSDIEVHSSGGGSGSCQSPGKNEDFAWFQKSVTVSHILRYLVLNDTQGQQVADKVFCEACQELSVSTNFSRLLVIKGIPKYITQEQAKNSIKKALQCCGGLYRDEIYIPSLIGSHLTDSCETTEPRHIKGHGVVELRLSCKVDSAVAALYKNTSYFCESSSESHFAVNEMMNLCEDFQVCTIDQNLQTSESRLQHILDEYLHQRLISQDGDLADNALIALTEIFHSCFIAEHRLSLSDPKHESGYICLSKEQITNQVQGNLFYTFLNSLKLPKQCFDEMVSEMLTNYGIVKYFDKDMLSEDEDRSSPAGSANEDKMRKERAATTGGHKQMTTKKTKAGKKSVELTVKDDTPCGASVADDMCDHFLTLDGFMQFVLHKAEDDGTAVWLAILACGYDIHCDRCCGIDDSQAIQMSRLWNLDLDSALVHYINSLCHKLSVTPSAIHPHEIHFSKAELASEEYFMLQDLPVESMRIRCRFLQTLNSSLESHFLPLIDMKSCHVYRHSTSAMLSAIRGLVFYNCKLKMFNIVLNDTALRRSEQAAPEVILNPLEVIGCDPKDVLKTQFCQAIRQLHQVPSSQLCVRPASGSDPMYAFNIRFTGEKVLGTSGSFRHFLSQVSKELQGPLLDLFVVCSSSSTNRNKGKYLLKPGPMTFSEEQLLIALGQLFGITIRAEIPLPVNFLPVFWKTIIGEPVNETVDFQAADIISFNYVKQFNMVTKMSDLERLLEDHQQPTFTYTTLAGKFIELCPAGNQKRVNWSNYKEYVDKIVQLRLSELRNMERVAAIRAGLASIIYLPMLTVMSPLDMEMRTCGVPQIDIQFLKAHTIYQSGLTETDNHIQFFWSVLESFSQDEVRKFVKFACNQDRIPMTCPCLSKTGSRHESAIGCGQSDSRGSLTVHVPPYPMKIAPADARPGLSANDRLIRVETCLFMIKIPEYTSRDVLTEKLLMAIHCRHDPLTG